MLTKTNKLLILSLVVTVFTMGFFVLAPLRPVFAQVSIDFPSSFAGFSSQDLKTTIENIVRIVLGFIGFIFLLLLLYAGFIWMTSGGDEKKITRAKKMIVSAVIGLLVTLSSYAIASFIVQRLVGVVNNGPVGGATGPGGFGFALGSGALESHYPGRNARDIPRNTNIYITFKEAMDVKTICDPGPNGIWDGGGDDPNRLLVSSIELKDLKSLVPTDSNDAANDNTLEGVTCQPTDPTNTTFKFDPTALLGTGAGNVPYTVTLIPHQIKTADAEDALAFGYSWRFTVNSVVDETPPKVLSTYPADLDTNIPRNSIVQINFSEPVDPTSASGLYAPTAVPASLYDSIILDTDNPPAPNYIEGSYASGNQYQTTEFITNSLCGLNSCGENVYCLPGTADIYGVVSGTITDMAGNYLDGDNDNAPGGNYTWHFQTNDTLDLIPPLMLTRTPGSGDTDVNVYNSLKINFSKRLSASSLNSTNVGLGRDYTYPPAGAITSEGNFWISKDDTQNLDAAADPEPETQILINHDIFLPFTLYHPGASSDIRDLSQNCYFPAQCDASPYDGTGSVLECN